MKKKTDEPTEDVKDDDENGSQEKKEETEVDDEENKKEESNEQVSILNIFQLYVLLLGFFPRINFTITRRVSGFHNPVGLEHRAFLVIEGFFTTLFRRFDGLRLNIILSFLLTE